MTSPPPGIQPDLPPLASLRGAGERTLKRLEKLGIGSVQDLLFHLPIRYEDRTRLWPLGDLRGGQSVLVEGWVEQCELITRSRRLLRVQLRDPSGTVELKFFHFTQAQRSQFLGGRRVRAFGEVRQGYSGFEITHPDYQLLNPGESGEIETSLTPIYPLTEGLHQKSLRSLITQALALHRLSPMEDWLARHPQPGQPTMPLHEALDWLHAPPPGHHEESPGVTAARARLAFEELLAHHLSLSRFGALARARQAPSLKIAPEPLARFRESLPFALTAAQRRVIGEITTDLAQSHPMMRLLQGDVGSGKTVVAAHAALTALHSHHQVAIMAPTELLAEQHAHSFRQWLEPLGVEVGFLSGRARGAGRREALERLTSGHIGVVIGTHALFQEQVRFHRLGLIIIDEQHRFGVHQRLALRDKGAAAGLYPHQLIMTATPIPRTLAMLGYADLELSIIDERPPGRTPVRTSVLPTTRRDTIIERIAHWVEQGRQAYWVCTLIEESEVLQAEAAEKSHAHLSRSLPHLRTALIHGKLPAEEKQATMEAFKTGSIDLLVATTVIEVGVDVPNASLMIIENAERLGLAQLHQLRGRVGRGPGESHCLLLYQTPLTRTARDRLGTLRDSDDGFLIAEKDLQIRGPGELLGTRQTGLVQFRIADLTRDGQWMEIVKASAESVIHDHPEQVAPLIERWLGASVQYAEA